MKPGLTSIVGVYSILLTLSEKWLWRKHGLVWTPAFWNTPLWRDITITPSMVLENGDFHRVCNKIQTAAFFNYNTDH